MIKSMRIGSVRLSNGFFLAPMASFTTLPFRRLCKEYGAGFTASEMISSEGVLHGNKKTEAMIASAENEKPFGIQIFGNEAKQIALAAAHLEKKCDILDINLGCPVRRITQQGSGASLLKKPEKIAEIFDSLTSIKIPVTAKMRLGFGTKTHCVDIAKLIERKGAAALTVHGRTARQDYSKKVDLSSIREIKNALSIPVIGNGDVFTPENAEEMFSKTKCDGVMIGRGALGNPFIFRQLNDYFENHTYSIPNEAERTAMFLKFLDYAKTSPISQLRMQSFQFTKGFSNAVEMRRKIMTAKTVEEIRKIAASGTTAH